jgi:hypothetical protein
MPGQLTLRIQVSAQSFFEKQNQFFKESGQACIAAEDKQARVDAEKAQTCIAAIADFLRVFPHRRIGHDIVTLSDPEE